jgi:hypothetical protein
MSDLTAVRMALAVASSPAYVRDAVERPLPRGMPTLLALASGEAATVERVSQSSGQSAHTLIAAAGFYIEQVLFHSANDHYRVLGCGPTSPASELRHNMALLLRWLHPDVAQRQGAGDRGVFASRVTQAWESVKNSERRATYDALLARRHAAARKPQRRSSAPRMAPMTWPAGEPLLARLSRTFSKISARIWGARVT